MPAFKVSAQVTVSCWTEVEASSEEEAIRIASSRDLAHIHIDESYPVHECWHMDADGMPQGLHVD